MKIAFYINILANGGAERVVANLANAFSQDNEVFVITTFPCNGEYVLNEKVKRINIEHTGKKENFIFRNVKRINALRHILKEYKPDTLVSFMGEPNFRSIIASVGLKIKTVISVRNDPKREYDSLLTRLLAKIFFRFADYAVFQTEDARHWFPKSIQKKSSIILNPVDDIFFNTSFNGERKNIVTTGRLTPQKNHAFLIKSFAQIVHKIKDNLYIYGEGELRSELEKLIYDLNLQERVFMPGAVKNVAETIKSARLFVLSSDFEGMPNALMEAMALNIPCISTDCPCGGPKTLLNKDFLVNVRDMEQMTSLILKSENKSFFKENYKLKAEMFSSKKIVKEWLEVLNEV